MQWSKKAKQELDEVAAGMLDDDTGVSKLIVRCVVESFVKRYIGGDWVKAGYVMPAVEEFVLRSLMRDVYAGYADALGRVRDR
jgi:hypothetical protein